MIELTIGGTTKRSNNGQHTVSVDWENLPEESRTFIVRYGLKQYLADGAAGAENADQLVAGVNARVAKLVAADFTRRSGDGPSKPDTETSIALKLAKELIRGKAKAANLTLDKEKVQAAAEAFLKRDDDAAKAIVKEAQRQIAAKAKLTTDGETDDDLLAALGLTE